MSILLKTKRKTHGSYSEGDKKTMKVYFESMHRLLCDQKNKFLKCVHGFVIQVN